MKKVPTLYVRDPETNLRYVKNELHPDCSWVAAGEGVAYRKWDGTCVMYDGTDWWTRREVKEGKPEPSGYQAIETDPNTGKTVGWEPAEQSSFHKFLQEALAVLRESGAAPFVTAGTFELIGPKINGNPEGVEDHLLIPHGGIPAVLGVPTSFDALAEWLRAWRPREGIVWHHPDGRMAKIKVKDFPTNMSRSK